MSNAIKEAKTYPCWSDSYTGNVYYVGSVFMSAAPDKFFKAHAFRRGLAVGDIEVGERTIPNGTRCSVLVINEATDSERTKFEPSNVTNECVDPQNNIGIVVHKLTNYAPTDNLIDPNLDVYHVIANDTMTGEIIDARSAVITHGEDEASILNEGSYRDINKFVFDGMLALVPDTKRGKGSIRSAERTMLDMSNFKDGITLMSVEHNKSVYVNTKISDDASTTLNVFRVAAYPKPHAERVIYLIVMVGHGGAVIRSCTTAVVLRDGNAEKILHRGTYSDIKALVKC